MQTRYFRKRNYNVDLWMSTGRPIKFKVVGKFGYLSSDDPQINNDPKILAEIDLGIREERGGVDEISAAQYEEEYVKKKELSPSSPELRLPYREEINPGIMPDTLNPLSKKPAAEIRPSESATRDPAVIVRSLRERANLGRR